MTIRYDGHTETVHEVEDHRTDPPTLEQPGESWCRCTCGEEIGRAHV